MSRDITPRVPKTNYNPRRYRYRGNPNDRFWFYVMLLVFGTPSAGSHHGSSSGPPSRRPFNQGPRHPCRVLHIRSLRRNFRLQRKIAPALAPQSGSTFRSRPSLQVGRIAPRQLPNTYHRRPSPAASLPRPGLRPRRRTWTRLQRVWKSGRSRLRFPTGPRSGHPRPSPQQAPRSIPDLRSGDAFGLPSPPSDRAFRCAEERSPLKEF